MSLAASSFRFNGGAVSAKMDDNDNESVSHSLRPVLHNLSSRTCDGRTSTRVQGGKDHVVLLLRCYNVISHKQYSIFVVYTAVGQCCLIQAQERAMAALLVY